MENILTVRQLVKALQETCKENGIEAELNYRVVNKAVEMKLVYCKREVSNIITTPKDSPNAQYNLFMELQRLIEFCTEFRKVKTGPLVVVNYKEGLFTIYVFQVELRNGDLVITNPNKHNTLDFISDGTEHFYFGPKEEENVVMGEGVLRRCLN